MTEDFGLGPSERWVIVTPARNEATCLPALGASLARQVPGSILRWIVVDDGSTDSTGEVARRLDLGFPVTVLRRDNDGGLRSGSDFGAFRIGASEALRLEPTASRVAKIDADIVLDDGYIAALQAAAGADLVGGVIANDRERTDHVRGALKAYTRQAWELVDTIIPTALGWDVLDEELLAMHSRAVVVVPEAVARVTRSTGASEGSLRGRVRAGVVSRWTGYHPAYFALRLIRYLFRRPYLSGAAAMLWGYASAAPSPFPLTLRRSLRQRQSRRLSELVHSPSSFLRNSYGAPAGSAARRRG